MKNQFNAKPRFIQDTGRMHIKYNALCVGATQVSVSVMKQDNSLVVQIADNGHGFDISGVDPKVHHGILSMRERVYSMNGRFNLESAIGEGTKISIEVPLQA